MARDPVSQAAAAKRHYESHKDAMKARARIYTEANRDRLRELIATAKAVPCADCGVRYPSFVMDFDHVRGTKQANVSDMVRRSIGIKRVKAEIAKCDVVCANCHRCRTYAAE